MILGIDGSRFLADRPTGVEVYTNHIIEGLIQHADALGYDEVRFYVKNAQQLERCNVLIHQAKSMTARVRLLDHGRFWTLVWLSWELLRNPIDALFVPSHTLPLMLPKRTILNPHGLESFSFPQAYSWFQRWYIQWNLFRAKKSGTMFIAVSQAVKKDLMRYVEIPEEKIRVVRLGFQRRTFTDPSAIPPEAGSVGVPKVDGVTTTDQVRDVILNIGRLEERKNQVRLVEAFEKIAGEFPEVKLVFVGGNGYGSEKVQLAVGSSQFAERIQMMGYQSDEAVQDLWSRAKVFAYPSLAEGFGIPILEAFDAGIPVLTSSGSACEEIAGSAAEFCDPLSVDSIAQGLRKLLKDPELREQKVQDGKKRLDLFSWERCVEETVALLKRA